MKTPTKIATFVAGLAAVFGGAVGVGALVGPVGPAEPEVHHPSSAATTAGTEKIPGGLMISDKGFTLALANDQLPAGPTTQLRFSVLGPDGRPVTAYDRSHDKDLHLIAVRRDLSGFQHLHPQLDGSGSWSVPVALTSGQWRVFADFVPAGGENLVLGADLAVSGVSEPKPLPPQSDTAQVDGYTVTLTGGLSPGRESELKLSIAKDGKPITDLQPYLGAYGHLVALRDGDLAYLHVHPAGAPGDGKTNPGPDITFYATTPSTGGYRLYLDFKHNGKVRTAEFTVNTTTGSTATTSPNPSTTTPTPTASASSHGHNGGGHG
ncbi:hypothetical protein GCM10029976_031470 [Kribbella albertanoniae]|uniref:Heavy-metal-associated domain-containing protein n=1 Tax=Kribbella albertanoniae TaxID=1266829 RepID=A0A4R4QHB2_9ACTN|nr:hypothetical protein [Kribbella albertanoniae]TDC35027.1 hypothetical protein E1261_02295 [Kribbella albertanoniae]